MSKSHVLLGCLALLLAGCQVQDDERAVQDDARPTAEAPARAMEACPMLVEATRVEAEDTDDGVALVFTTDTGDVGELRQRVRHLAAMHERRMAGEIMWHPMHAERGPEGAPHGMRGGVPPRRGMMDGGHMGQRGPAMPEADAEVEEVERGARLVLTPRDPAQRDEVRRHARMHEAHMSEGRCWAWQERAPAPPPGS